MLRFLMSRLRLSGEDMLPGGTTTPLMKAVASRSAPLADILVSCRELLNAVDARGRTALDMALERGDGEMAALLRRHGGITGEERKRRENIPPLPLRLRMTEPEPGTFSELVREVIPGRFFCWKGNGFC